MAVNIRWSWTLAAPLALGLLMAPVPASADWWEDEGLFDTTEYSEGIYEDGFYNNEDWYYDSYGEGYDETGEQTAYTPYYDDYSGYYEEEEEQGLFDF